MYIGNGKHTQSQSLKFNDNDGSIVKKLVHGSTKLRFGELDGFSSENAAVYQDGWENVRLVLRSLQSSDNEVFTKDTIAYKALRVLFRHRTAKDGLGKTFKEITRVNVVYGHMLGVHGQLFSEKHGALLLRRSWGAVRKAPESAIPYFGQRVQKRNQVAATPISKRDSVPIASH